LVLVGGDSQDARAVHGASRSAMVHPSAFVLNGPRLVVVATPGLRNGPLLSTRSDDDNKLKTAIQRNTGRGLQITFHVVVIVGMWRMVQPQRSVFSHARSHAYVGFNNGYWRLEIHVTAITSALLTLIPNTAYLTRTVRRLPEPHIMLSKCGRCDHDGGYRYRCSL